MLEEGRTGTLPDGTRVVVRNGQIVPLQAPRLTEDQGKASGWARGMLEAERQYETAIRLGYNPTSIRNSVAAFVEPIPGLNGLGRVIRDDASDRGRAAELNFADLALRGRTGAAATEPETQRIMAGVMFPQSGEGPNAAATKRAARDAEFSGVMMRSGPGARGLPQALISPTAPLTRDARPVVSRSARDRPAAPGSGSARNAPRAPTQPVADLPRRVVTVSTPAEAQRLSPGTLYRTPDGREYVR
jgi:hypothetical protein